MYVLKFNAFGHQCAVQSFLSPCSASCFYVVNVIGNMDWVLFFCKPLSWRYAREQTPVRQVSNLYEGARYALHGLITWTASEPTVSAFAFTNSSGNSYLGCFFSSMDLHVFYCNLVNILIHFFFSPLLVCWMTLIWLGTGKGTEIHLFLGIFFSQCSLSAQWTTQLERSPFELIPYITTSARRTKKCKWKM